MSPPDYKLLLYDWLNAQSVDVWLALGKQADRRLAEMHQDVKLIAAAKETGQFSRPIFQALVAIEAATRCIITCVCHQIPAHGQKSMALASTSTRVADAAQWMVCANNALLLGLEGVLPRQAVNRWWDTVLSCNCSDRGTIESLLNELPG
jgi:hypothetical protein